MNKGCLFLSALTLLAHVCFARPQRHHGSSLGEESSNFDFLRHMNDVVEYPVVHSPDTKTATLNVQKQRVVQEIMSEQASLESLMVLALSRHPSLRAAKQEVDVSQKSIFIERLGHLPDLSFDSSYTHYKKIAKVLVASEPEPYTLYNYGLDLKVTLYDGFKVDRAISVAQTDLEINRVKVMRERMTILEGLIEAYFNVVADDVELSQLNYEIKNAKEHLRLVQEQYQKGIGKRLNIKDVEVRIFEAEIEKADLLSRSKDHKQALRSYLALDEPHFSHFKTFSFQPYASFDLPELSSITHIESGADVKIAELEVNKAKQEWSKQISDYSPSVKAFASYGSSDRDEFTTRRKNTEYSFGLSLSWGIDGAYKNYHEVRKRIIETEVLTSELDDSKNENDKKIKMLYSDAVNWNAQRKLARALNELVQEKISIAHEEFEVGLITEIDMMDVEVDLRKKELKMQLAEIEFKKAMLLLELFLDQRIVPVEVIP